MGNFNYCRCNALFHLFNLEFLCVEALNAIPFLLKEKIK